MKAAKPKNHYTVGINDDVTHQSLPVGPEVNTVRKEPSAASSGALVLTVLLVQTRTPLRSSVTTQT